MAQALKFKVRRNSGVSQKDYKEWRAGNFRVTRVNAVQGVKVPTHFHAAVLVGSQWLFAGRRGPYKTFIAAAKACNKYAREHEVREQAASEGRRRKPGKQKL